MRGRGLNEDGDHDSKKVGGFEFWNESKIRKLVLQDISFNQWFRGKYSWDFG